MDNKIKTIHRDVTELPTIVKNVIKENTPKNIETVINNIAEYQKVDPKTLHDNLKKEVQSKNSNIANAATKTINGFISELSLLTLKQVLISEFGVDYMQKFNAKFRREELDVGNSIQYLKTILTGHDEFLPDAYNPTTPTDGINEAQTFNMYKTGVVGQQLEDYAFRYQKNYTDREAVFIPYFVTDKLLEVISMIIAAMYKTFDLKLYDINMKLACTKANYVKQITGTATDMFLAFSGEILPEIEKMKYLSSEYNLVGGSAALISSNTEDLIMILPNNIKVAFEAGIRSQLFNAQFMDINKVVGEVLATGKTLVIGDGKTAITTTTDEYITANTCIVLSIASIINHFQINKASIQNYANNLVTEHILHFFGLANFTKWGQGFYYENPNLSTQPSAVTP